jgi:hypothetical protein
MNAIANVSKVVGFQRTDVAIPDVGREARNAFLSELPGAVFSFITLAYVVTSLLGLA